MSESKRNVHQQVIKRATTSPEVSAFEQIKHEDEHGEYWSARELAKLLGYERWENFAEVIEEAKEICSLNGSVVEEVFRAVTKNPTRKGGRPGVDYRLTRHACYIIAQSADGRKPQVAFATQYFARAAEQYDSRMQAQVSHQRAGREALYCSSGSADVLAPTDLARTGSAHAGANALAAAAEGLSLALAHQMVIDRGVADKSARRAVHHEAGASVRALLVEKGIYPERLPTPNKSYQQLLREEEVRQRLLLEDQTGLWARLLAGQVDSLDDSFNGEQDEPGEDDAAAE